MASSSRASPRIDIPPLAIRLVYVGNHRLMREGLIRFIETQPDLSVVGEAGSPQDAVECFRCCQPDVTLVDLQWWGMAGVNAIQSVRRLRPDARIVAVARTAADYTTILALEAGVMGCVVSTASGGELLQTIRAVHQGRLALPCDVDEVFGVHGVQQTLTPRQVEVLQLIAAGLRNAEISTRLQISQQTVKLHVRAILARLNARDRTQALSIGLRHGIVHLEP